MYMNLLAIKKSYYPNKLLIKGSHTYEYIKYKRSQ